MEFSFKFTDMIAHMIEKKWGERKKINKSSGVGRPHAELDLEITWLINIKRPPVKSSFLRPHRSTVSIVTNVNPHKQAPVITAE
jgi:hypothetical protein